MPTQGRVKGSAGRGDVEGEGLLLYLVYQVTAFLRGPEPAGGSVGAFGKLSGDGGKLAQQLAKNMYEKMRITLSISDINADNIAAVMVTANMPAFLEVGSRMDVLISSIGAAENLQGGTLLQTPLQGADGHVYAVAQGPLSTGGFAAGGKAATLTKNHPTVARIPSGAIIEKRVSTIIRPLDDLHFVFHAPDYTTIVRAAESVNSVFKGAAVPVDAITLKIEVPFEFRTSERLAMFISQVQMIKVVPDSPARVVVNERTGTIVVGEHVKISTVAISHGSLTISIKETTQTSQPNPFANGETTTEESTDITVEEEKPGMHVVEDAATLSELADALNLLGVSPRDMVSIFQALKQAGALQAELIII